MRPLVYALVLLVLLELALSSVDAGFDLFGLGKDKDKDKKSKDGKNPLNRKAKSGESEDDDDLISQITKMEQSSADYKSAKSDFKRPRRFRDLQNNLKKLELDEEAEEEAEQAPPKRRQRPAPAERKSATTPAYEEEEEEEDEVEVEPKKKDDWGAKFLQVFQPKKKEADKSPLEEDDDEYEYEDEEEADDGRPVEKNGQGYLKAIEDEDRGVTTPAPQGSMISTRKDGPEVKDKTILRPKLNYLVAPEEAKRQFEQANKSKYFSRRKLKAKLKKAYLATKEGVVKPMVDTISGIPKSIISCTNGLQACIPITNKGYLLSMLDEVDKDIAFVRQEFSQFSLTWSPLMMRGLNVLGTTGLNKIKWDDSDQLELRPDALMSVVFGYEFMRMMIVWRENMLIGHYAFHSYLDTVIDDLGFAANAETIDKNLAFQLESVHYYILYRTWLTIERAIAESKLKLDQLMMVNDDRKKNYEIEYFRNIVVLQELYVPTIDMFERERMEIVEGVSKAGVMNEEAFNKFFDDIDQFYDNFRKSLAVHEFKDIDWEVPKRLTDFIKEMEPELRFNSLIYRRQFLRELKDTLNDPRSRRELFEVPLQTDNDDEGEDS